MVKITLASILRTLLGAGLITGAALAQAQAQNPNPVRIVIGLPAGGALDNMARAMAEKLRPELGQTVIIENRPGAGTQIATLAVKRAAPDGNTILLAPPSVFTIFPLTYEKLPYDFEKDFVSVAHLADVPMAVTTGAGSPYSNMKEYLDWVKKNPEQSGVGLVALGGVGHFGLLGMNQYAGLKLVPVAYKGAPNMLTDEIGGVLPVGIDTISSASELEKAGKIKYLGVTGTERTRLAPAVPTMKEQGVQGFELSTTGYGAYVPAGTPKAVVDKFQKIMIAVVKDPEFTKKMEHMGIVTTGRTGESMTAAMRSQREAWRPVVEKSGFRAQ